MVTELSCRDPEDTVRLGQAIGQRLGRGAVISLEGPLGAGKTTLVKGIALALGVEEPVTSPAFTIISQYRGAKEGAPVELYHIDLYRIGHVLELADLGLEEVLAGPGIAVVEWGEKASPLLPPETVRVRIDFSPDGCRLIRIESLSL